MVTPKSWKRIWHCSRAKPLMLTLASSARTFKAGSAPPARRTTSSAVADGGPNLPNAKARRCAESCAFCAALHCAIPRPRLSRSEEHTSELQSHLNLVCRLLLEKKKTTYSTHDTRHSSHDALKT